MTGRAVAGPGREALVTREIKRPGRVRTEFTSQGTTGVFAFDGKRGWQISPLTGVLVPSEMAPDDTLAAIGQADLDGPLVAARKQGAVLTLVGRETIVGRDARITPGALPRRRDVPDRPDRQHPHRWRAIGACRNHLR